MALCVIYAAKMLQAISRVCGFRNGIHGVRVADITTAENENAARVQDPPSTPYKFIIALSAFGIIVTGVMVSLIIANRLIDESHLDLRVLGTQFSNVTINIENDKVSLGGVVGLRISFWKNSFLRLYPDLGSYTLSIRVTEDEILSTFSSGNFRISNNEQQITMKFESREIHLGEEDLKAFKKNLHSMGIRIKLEGALDMHFKLSKVVIFRYTYRRISFSCKSKYKSVQSTDCIIQGNF